MAFVSKVGVSYADSSALLTDASDGLHPLMLAAGWELFDELDATPGSEDRVYKSAGEDADEVLFLRITHNSVSSRLYFRAYGLWDEVNHAGYFQVGDASGATALQCGASMTGWLAVDKDGAAVVVKAGASYRKFLAQRLNRVTPAGVSGRTTLAAPVDGKNLTGQKQLYVAADAPFTLFVPDMKIWVVNQRIDSGVNAELLEIQSVNAGTRTIFCKTNLVNDYDFGALVAQSPQPMLLWGDLAGQWEDADPWAMYGPDAYLERVVAHGCDEIPVDLDAYGNLLPRVEVFYQSDPGKEHIYGHTNGRVMEIPLAPVASEDTLSYGGKDHVIFKETSQAFSIQVS